MYLIHELAKLSGTTTRTLRYYDQIGLLKPASVDESGYRRYEEPQVNLLQQILMYKKLGFDLKEIKRMIYTKNFDHLSALNTQLKRLYHEMGQLKVLVQTIEKTISYHKGEMKMSDKEKFEGLKEKQIQDNENKYGKEVRDKYGDQAVDESNIKFRKQTKADYDDAQHLAVEILDKLKEALIISNPASEIAQEVCKLHQKWIKHYWVEYNKEAHLALVNMYLADERFKVYYEKVGEGATQLLVDAMTIYLSKH